MTKGYTQGSQSRRNRAHALRHWQVCSRLLMPAKNDMCRQMLEKWKKSQLPHRHVS